MYRLYLGFSTLLLGLLLSACSMKEYTLFQEENQTVEPTRLSDEQYQGEMLFENKIATNDRIAINVYNQSGLQGQQLTAMVNTRDDANSAMQERRGMLVTKNGTVRLPLLNAVKISGLTEDEAANMLIEKYKKYLQNKSVNICSSVSFSAKSLEIQSRVNIKTTPDANAIIFRIAYLQNISHRLT